MTLSAALPSRDPQDFSHSYELLWQCFLSGQINSRQWDEHLKDELFAAWVVRQERRAQEKLR
jgi:hypothetical protein